MSWQALGWGSEVKAGSAAKKLLLIAMCEQHRMETGLCYPSVDTLADWTEQDPRTVRKGLAELVADGLLRDTGKRTGRTGQVVVYTLPKFEEFWAGKQKTDKNVRVTDSDAPLPPQPADLTSENTPQQGADSKDSQNCQASNVPRETSLTNLHAKPDVFASESPTKMSPNPLRGTSSEPSPESAPRTLAEKDARLQTIFDQLPPAGSKARKGDLRREHVAFWQGMRAKFGMPWFNTHGNEPTPQWIELLDRYNRSGDYAELPALLERIKREWKTNFPPAMDRVEDFLQRITAKLSPYDETERRQFWTSHILSQTERQSSALGICTFGTRFGELRHELRRDVMSRLPEWLDRAVRWEKQAPPIPHKQILDDLDGDLSKLLKFFQPASLSQLARDEKLANEPPPVLQPDRRAVSR